MPSNLRIVDYCIGNTGSAHDSSAFDHTAAAENPEWFFKGREFAWTDSAYTVNSRTIPVHKQPASNNPRNALFDKYVSRLRVRSEHCMGALKGRWQSLRGLRIQIKDAASHKKACRWFSCCVLLHNAVLDIEGWVAGVHFTPLHTRVEEEEDSGEQEEGLQEEEGEEGGNRNARREELVAEINLAKEMGYIN